MSPVTWKEQLFSGAIHQCRQSVQICSKEQKFLSCLTSQTAGLTSLGSCSTSLHYITHYVCLEVAFECYLSTIFIYTGRLQHELLGIHKVFVQVYLRHAGEIKFEVIDGFGCQKYEMCQLNVQFRSVICILKLDSLPFIPSNFNHLNCFSSTLT